MIYQVRERSAFTVMQRLHVDGVNMTTADVASITFAVYPTAGGAAVATGTLVAADVVFDTLQLDGMWDTDEVGYNFLHELSHTTITTAGLYVIEYRVTCGATVFFAEPIKINASKIFTT